MYNGSNVSLKTILWKVMNNPLAADLTYELAAEYALEAIKLIGTPLTLINKVTNPPIKITNYKAALPIDIIDTRGVRAMSEQDSPESEKYAMTIASDLYHNNSACDDTKICNSLGRELTYVIDNGVIKTSFQNGYIEVSYKALPVDEEGFPLVPNNQKAALAIEFYILERYLYPLYLIGKITDKAYNSIDQKKCWYMGAANTNMQIQNYDHVEGIMNSINRIILDSNAHKNFFKGASQKEKLKRYN